MEKEGVFNMSQQDLLCGPNMINDMDDPQLSTKRASVQQQKIIENNIPNKNKKFLNTYRNQTQYHHIEKPQQDNQSRFRTLETNRLQTIEIQFKNQENIRLPHGY